VLALAAYLSGLCVCASPLFLCGQFTLQKSPPGVTLPPDRRSRSIERFTLKLKCEGALRSELKPGVQSPKEPMQNLMNRPVEIFLLSFILMWLATRLGAYIHGKRPDLDEAERDDYDIVLTATLTLLGLIIGFSFSMAVSRYDQRKNYEEAEANAIGTEYVRAELLPTADAAHVQDLLRAYLDQRILYYSESRERDLLPINDRTAHIQDQLWSALRGPASATPTAITAVAIVGMNDVLNSQGYTQAAWWNRIPTAAWLLMFAIALCSNVLVGFGSRTRHRGLFLILPLVAAISFFLIADIDSPRGGTIRIHPQNLEALAQSLK
jgi:hypothetical protein